MKAPDFLKKIVDYKFSLLKEKQAFYASLKKKIEGQTFSNYGLFRKRISSPGTINLIAEIKKASPSKGVIRKNFDCLQLAKIYDDNNAAALSILTEDKFFLGKFSYIRQVSENFSLPILNKDFIIDEVQVYEAFYNGASAVLLIVAILDDKTLKHLIKVAMDLDMDCLIEVHDEDELKRALAQDVKIIGINNRNLQDFNVDLRLSEELIPRIPKEKIIVVESGIHSHREIKLFKELGANAVLIGEAFLKEADVDKKVKEIMLGEG